MSRIGVIGFICVPRFPRVSGDEPIAQAMPDVATTFSPRERG